MSNFGCKNRCSAWRRKFEILAGAVVSEHVAVFFPALPGAARYALASQSWQGDCLERDVSFMMCKMTCAPVIFRCIRLCLVICNSCIYLTRIAVSCRVIPNTGCSSQVDRKIVFVARGSWMLKFSKSANL